MSAQKSPEHHIDTELLKNISVLCVEDEDDTREQLLQFLMSRVGTLHTASNGQEGLEAFKLHKPDVVITDVKMPVMNGVKMAKGIKGINRETPIIIITAYPDKDLLIEAINIGVDKYLYKPVSPYKLIEAVCECAIILYHYERLKHRAITDELTGLYNRTKFNESLLTEIKKTVRYKVPLSLIMIDIDHFKPVNDKHGHQAGDVVLQELAELITRNVREQDIVTRWGGEEFMILSPFNYVKNAAKLSEKLRVKIEWHRFHDVGTVTCSFGVTQFRDGDTPDSFTRRVDKALYKAKKNGRNRVATE